MRGVAEGLEERVDGLADRGAQAALDREQRGGQRPVGARRGPELDRRPEVGLLVGPPHDLDGAVRRASGSSPTSEKSMVLRPSAAKREVARWLAAATRRISFDGKWCSRRPRETPARFWIVSVVVPA